MTAFRPRRSALYMPGSNTRALEKAATLPADCLLLDLEDAVAPEAKVEARAQVAEAVAAKPYGKREVVIRVNALATEWGGEDLAAAAKAAPDAILIPKVESSADLGAVRGVLAEAKAVPEIALWAMMETPLAMLNAQEIAAAARADAQPLQVFVMGTNDLAKETGAALVEGRAPMLSWLSHCVAAASAYGFEVVDGVYKRFPQRGRLKAGMQAGPRFRHGRQDVDPPWSNRTV